jgi:hypothetical protein
MRWEREVYGRGLAAASGLFVFEAVEEVGGGLSVIAGRQGRGGSLSPAYAAAARGRSGWALTFEGLPKPFDSPPDNPQSPPPDDYYRRALRRMMSESLDF